MSVRFRIFLFKNKCLCSSTSITFWWLISFSDNVAIGNRIVKKDRNSFYYKNSFQSKKRSQFIRSQYLSPFVMCGAKCLKIIYQWLKSVPTSKRCHCSMWLSCFHLTNDIKHPMSWVIAWNSYMLSHATCFQLNEKFICFS